MTMMTFNITGFFNTIPHSYLLNPLRKFCIPLPIVKWVHTFLSDQKAAICLDGKHDDLKGIGMGIPQGSCTSPILVAFFTAPLSEAIRLGTMETVQNDPELSCNLNPNHNTLSPLTLYIDNGSIAASA